MTSGYISVYPCSFLQYDPADVHTSHNLEPSCKQLPLNVPLFATKPLHFPFCLKLLEMQVHTLRSGFPKVLRVPRIDILHEGPRRPTLAFQRRHANRLQDLILAVDAVLQVHPNMIVRHRGAVSGIQRVVLAHGPRAVERDELAQTRHVLAQVLEDGAAVPQNGVCREERAVGGEEEAERVGGVAGGVDDFKGHA